MKQNSSSPSTTSANSHPHTRTIFGGITIFTLLVIFIFLGMNYQKIRESMFPPQVTIRLDPDKIPEYSQVSDMDENNDLKNKKTTLKTPISKSMPHVTLALVACGQKRNVRSNVLNSIKSAIFFSRDVHLKVILFKDAATDKGQKETIDVEVEKLKKSADVLGRSFQYEIRDSWFPDSDGINWRDMYLSCSTQRHFFTTVLPDEDSLIYMDADTIFLGNLKDAWDIFSKMNPVQIMGMIGEHEPPADGYYNTRSKVPFYGPRGLNSGVAFMNLTRMRQVEYEKHIINIGHEFNGTLYLPDQDMINIFFARNQNLMLPVSCAFNFRKGHCMCDNKNTGACNCVAAENEGILLAHGNIDGFANAPLKSVVNHMKLYDLEHGNPNDLLKSIIKNWSSSHNKRHKNTCLRKGMQNKLLTRFHKYNSQQ